MRYGYVTVGAGSAGCAPATRLSNDPQSSALLLEAGPDYPDFERLPVEVNQRPTGLKRGVHEARDPLSQVRYPIGLATAKIRW